MYIVQHNIKTGSLQASHHFWFCSADAPGFKISLVCWQIKTCVYYKLKEEQVDILFI